MPRGFSLLLDYCVKQLYIHTHICMQLNFFICIFRKLWILALERKFLLPVSLKWPITKDLALRLHWEVMRKDDPLLLTHKTEQLSTKWVPLLKPWYVLVIYMYVYTGLTLGYAYSYITARLVCSGLVECASFWNLVFTPRTRARLFIIWRWKPLTSIIHYYC